MKPHQPVYSNMTTSMASQESNECQFHQAQKSTLQLHMANSQQQNLHASHIFTVGALLLHRHFQQESEQHSVLSYYGEG